MIPTPFAYPDRPHVRVHGPHGYTRSESYKEWLRDDFWFRCVYCLERERWHPSGSAAFGVDHVKPKGNPTHSNLILVYENMVYSCNRCNSAKSDILILDPCVVALGDHLRVGPDGVIAGITPEGTFLIKLLGLDQPGPTSERRKRLRLISLHQKYPQDPEVQELYYDAFGFPDDLPDLGSLKPEGNTKPAGIGRSHHRRREERTLPNTY